MCSGSKRKDSTGSVMEDGALNGDSSGTNQPSSILLELSATNDFDGFKHAVEEEGYDMDEASLWYGRRVGTKKMGIEERTPLMVASMFGSKDVVNYILQKGLVDVNRACGSDGATALHCAAAGGSFDSHEVIKLLIDSSADINRVDAHGHRPADVVAPKRKIPELLPEDCKERSESDDPFDQSESPKSSNDGNGSEKKEYPFDPSLPDIKNGIYGTDEFRMYTFKVKPCSRAYSHDWTECPFAHPGENARRRDPKKYHYSCVPCPEFRKGSCPKGDACEYAHGIFECWLHPAQYRTRLCKDETGCARRVCFFAHKREELRPLYPSTGSAVPSPRSYSPNPNSFEMPSLSPLSLGSPSMVMPSTSTPPMTPTGASSPMGGPAAWQNHLNVTPPTLQLPGSRLKAALCARDMDLEVEFRRQQLLDELAGLSVSSPNRLGNLNPTNLHEIYGSIDPMMAQTQLQSPTGIQMRQNMNQQLRSSYSSGLPSSPVRTSSPFGIDPCGSPASNPRMVAFAKRSHSFIDRGMINRPTPTDGLKSPFMTDWGSPDGKLDWGIQGDELSKLRKSSSFGPRTNGTTMGGNPDPIKFSPNEPDVSWVQSLVKESQGAKTNQFGFEEQYRLNSGGSERVPPWVEPMYMEQEPMAA